METPLYSSEQLRDLRYLRGALERQQQLHRRAAAPPGGDYPEPLHSVALRTPRSRACLAQSALRPGGLCRAHHLGRLPLAGRVPAWRGRPLFASRRGAKFSFHGLAWDSP